MGCGKSSGVEVTQVSAPPAAATPDAMKQWAEALPQVYKTQLEYAPKEAAQQLALLKQYGTPIASEYANINKALYPETAKLQEDLATQASKYINAERIPESMAQEYRSQLSAALGTNAGSPIGADYLSRQMINQGMGYKQYYENLGLSLAGRQPLAQGNMPQYSNYMSDFGPSAQLNYGLGGYQAQTAAQRPFVTPVQGGVNLGILGRWEV